MTIEHSKGVLMTVRLRHLVLAVALTVLATATAVRAQPDPDPVDDPEKIAQTGLQFLTVQVNPRGAALGGTRVAEMSAGASAMWYNPASMAAMDAKADVSFSQSQFIADISYNQASIAFQPANGQYGTIGAHFMSVDYGEIRQNIRFDNDRGYRNIGTVSPTALAFGVGYGYPITDRVQVGGNVKYVQQDLGTGILSYQGDGESERISNQVSTAAFDFGLLYDTGFRGLSFGMNVRNFAGELTYQRESFEPPLTFEIGLSQDLVAYTGLSQDVHSLELSVTGAHPRSYVQQLKIGGQYGFSLQGVEHDVLQLRAGYVMPKDEESVNLGAGLYHSFGGLGVGVDYAYTDFGVFGTVNRLGLNVSF